MARLKGVEKGLRGPFKRLVRKLELTLRKPVIGRLGPGGRRIANHFRAKDEATALSAARKEAAAVRAAKPKPRPAMSSAAVDRRTGDVVAVGHCRDRPDIPAELEAVLPTVSVEDWAVTNCGEVSVASQGVRAGSRLEDLVIRTVRTMNETEAPPCGNCQTWVPGKD